MLLPPLLAHQLIQVNDTGGGVTCLTGVSELGGDGGALEEPGPAARLIRDVVVVVRLEVLLADEQLAEGVERSVYIHVEGEQPLPQSLPVDERKPMKDEVRAFGAPARINATLVDHLLAMQRQEVS